MYAESTFIVTGQNISEAPHVFKKRSQIFEDRPTTGSRILQYAAKPEMVRA
jgi:hypothetical protein